MLFKKVKKSAYFKRMYGLLGNAYRVTTLSELYLTVVQIIM